MKLESLKREKILRGEILTKEHYFLLSSCLSSLPVDIYLDTNGIITDGIYGIWFQIARPAPPRRFQCYSFLSVDGVLHGNRNHLILSDSEIQELRGFAVHRKKEITALSRKKLTARSFVQKLIKEDISYAPFSPMREIKPPVCHYRYYIEVSTGLEALFKREKECHPITAFLAGEILNLKNAPTIEDDGFHYRRKRDYTRASILFAFDDITIPERVNRYAEKEYGIHLEKKSNEDDKDWAIRIIETMYSLDEEATVNELFPDWKRMLIYARNTLALGPDREKHESKLYVEYADILLDILPGAVLYPLYT